MASSSGIPPQHAELADPQPAFIYRIVEGVLEGAAGGSWRGLWSGRQAGLNNPAAVSQSGLGPLPPGLYVIGQPINHPHLGPHAIPLRQVGGVTFGRAGFFIHGASRTAPAESSHGCIIAPRPVRVHVTAVCSALSANSRILKVVSQ